MSQLVVAPVGRLGLMRQRSRARAAFNLFGIPLLIIAGLLWLAGVRP